MLTVESANNGRNGVLGFVGTLIFGAAAACFIIFMGGTLGIVLGSVCGAIGLCCGIGGLAANWVQSKKERDAALAYHQSGTLEHAVNIVGKGVNVIKSVGKAESKQQTKEEDAKSVSTQASDNTSKTTKIISKIVKADGTTSIIEGPLPLNKDAENNLELVSQKIHTITTRD